MSGHFVIEINVKEVTKEEPVASTYSRSDAPKAPAERVITDLVHVVTKADTKDAAIVKAVSILELERD